MAAVRLIQPGSGKALEVADDEAAKFWEGLGYTREPSQETKATAKKASSRKTSK